MRANPYARSSASERRQPACPLSHPPPPRPSGSQRLWCGDSSRRRPPPPPHWHSCAGTWALGRRTMGGRGRREGPRGWVGSRRAAPVPLPPILSCPCQVGRALVETGAPPPAPPLPFPLSSLLPPLRLERTAQSPSRKSHPRKWWGIALVRSVGGGGWGRGWEVAELNAAGGVHFTFYTLPLSDYRHGATS